MDPDTVIKVEGLHKKFTSSLKRSMLYGTQDLLRNLFGFGSNRRLRKSEFWALEDVSFELKKGETVGVIGVNGSGKSTLLRLLTGIFPPDKGSISIRGRMGSLIAVGAGFHPHMSGRENIYLNGVILGMTREEVDRKFDQIASFAEIGDFLDAPVSTYSSGMRVRLGFAIAVHSHADILLVDEILSVGDIGFRNKSLRKMEEFRSQANALIFVSHDIEQIRVLCTRVIIMDKGRVVYDGDTHKGVVVYEEMTRDIRLGSIKTENAMADSFIKRGIDDNETLEVIDMGVFDSKGAKTESVAMDEEFSLFCDFELKSEVSSLSFYMTLRRDDTDKDSILVVSNDGDKLKAKSVPPGKYRIKSSFKEHHLTPGVYNPNISFRNDQTFETYRKIYSNIPFKVRSDGNVVERGMVNVTEEWELQKI